MLAGACLQAYSGQEHQGGQRSSFCCCTSIISTMTESIRSQLPTIAGKCQEKNCILTKNLNRELHQHHFNKGKSFTKESIEVEAFTACTGTQGRRTHLIAYALSAVRDVLAKPTMLIYPHCLCQGVQQQAGGQSSGSLKASLHPKEAERIVF